MWKKNFSINHPIFKKRGMATQNNSESLVHINVRKKLKSTVKTPTAWVTFFMMQQLPFGLHSLMSRRGAPLFLVRLAAGKSSSAALELKTVFSYSWERLIKINCRRI